MPLSLMKGHEGDRAFGVLALLVQGLLATAFCFTNYNLFAHSVFESIRLVEIYKGMALFAIVGFGFLYAFLKAYGVGAISMALFILSLGMQWSLLVEEAMEQGTIKNLTFDFSMFMGADFAVMSSLIGFGALVGKTSPTQVLLFTLLSIAAYSANMVFFLEKYLDAYDVGGTMSVHVFGAVFGLATSRFFGPANNEALLEGSRNSERIAMMGSLALQVFWPSMISASLPAGSKAQFTAVMNTICALCGSTVSAFGYQAAFDPERGGHWCEGGRLHPHAISVARFGGGVAIGACAGLPIGPGPSMLIGNIAGILAAWGYHNEFVPMRYDTMGITYLNLMPGILGALASALAPQIIPGSGIVPENQAFGLLGTIVFAAASGALTGLLLSCVGVPRVAYNDEAFIDVSHNEHAKPKSLMGKVWENMRAAVGRRDEEIGH